MRHFLVISLCWLLATSSCFAQEKSKTRSHPPLRAVPAPSKRPMDKGPGYFLDPFRGDDAHDGTEAAPWQTFPHALRRLKAGDTLYLRGGYYYDTLTVRLVGHADAPITIRSYPGEQAILDGGLIEFFAAPEEAWEANPKAAEGEYRSRAVYPNLRHVVGWFGDSMIGLHTYYHAKDLRATNELWEFVGGDSRANADAKPFYCGPGLWYDAETGRIHVRLAHTHLPQGYVNYQGETDPRKLRLVIAPFRSVPLTLDGARHVRLQDLVVRGAGYDSIVIQQSADIELDNLTVWCGSYGLRATGAQRLKVLHSGLHGSVPPWTFRSDTSLQSYPGRPHRDVTRLGTHALLVQEAGREFEVYHLPLNDDWEIAHCDFTDAHDGVYLGGVNMRFHNNRLLDVQDDGIYLSPMYNRNVLGKGHVHIYGNYFGRSLTALAFGGPEKVTEDTIWFYRNIVDLRGELLTGRPSPKNPQGGRTGGKVIGDHGSPPWSAMNVYHNTFVMDSPSRGADMVLTAGATAERPKRIFNNIFLHLSNLSALSLPDTEGLESDGNLYWQPGLDAKRAATFFDKYRASPAFAKSKTAYPPGSTTHSRVADPKFIKAEADPSVVNDYRLQEGSPAVDAGVALPADWTDPLRQVDKGKPDIGALPLGAPPLAAGRAADQSPQR